MDFSNLFFHRLLEVPLFSHISPHAFGKPLVLNLQCCTLSRGSGQEEGLQAQSQPDLSIYLLTVGICGNPRPEGFAATGTTDSPDQWSPTQLTTRVPWKVLTRRFYFSVRAQPIVTLFGNICRCKQDEVTLA